MRLKALHRLVDEWEAEHGDITVAELEALEDKVAKARRAAKRASQTGRNRSRPSRRFVNGATFDTGTLVALDRNDREAWIAVVMESAGRRHDDVYTADAGDLEHLAEHITNQVAIIPIGR